MLRLNQSRFEHLPHAKQKIEILEVHDFFTQIHLLTEDVIISKPVGDTKYDRQS
jgi:hypothetical protein